MKVVGVVAMLALLPPVAAGSSPALVVGPNVNVSRAAYAQSEVRVAVDPSNPDVLLAGSNSEGDDAMRVYGSSDGGSTWSSDPLPPTAPGSRPLCAADPAYRVERARVIAQ